jgi:hypothetical protein
MAAADVFDQKRLERCIAIHQTIMQSWQDTGQLTYTVRATQRLAGLSLDELQKQTFAVGVGEKLQEIPFFDMLMVLSMLEQTSSALQSKSGELKMIYPRSFSDAEAARLISAIHLETPMG